MLVQGRQTGGGRSGPVGRRGRKYGGRRRAGHRGDGRVLWRVQARAEVGRGRRGRGGRGHGRRARDRRGLRLLRHLQRLALMARRHQPVKVELVGVPLSVHFRHDVLVVVVPVRNQRLINIITHER